MIPGDTDPVAPFAVVYLPAKPGAECPGCPKRALNSP